jgi:hypothetical protein
MEHPEGHTPRAFCEALIDATFPEAAGPEADAFVDWAAAHLCDLGLVTLNAAALMAVRRRAWTRAADLASEVNARDHHDLLAQRVFDAAQEKSPTLQCAADEWLKSRFCAAPFDVIETRATGDIHFCCSAWQPAPIGKLGGDRDAFWNSPRAQEIRRSILEGDFSHCSRWHCPHIAERRLPAREKARSAGAKPHRDVINARATRLASRPARVVLSHDRSCNISCPSCRSKVIMLKRWETEALNAMVAGTFFDLIASARSIKITGSGDAFASHHFRYLIKRLTSEPGPARRLQIHTNGLLFTERTWCELNLWENVDSVWVSIDATRAETYAKTRRGGMFERLMTNLEFLGTMRRAGAFNELRLDFVVQRLNYEEAPEVVDLANRIGADGVYFLLLRNWGTFSANEFRIHDVCHPEHPEHARLLERLSDPRLVSRGVELGSLAPLVRKARALGRASLAPLETPVDQPDLSRR